jgi:hypothetical protein
VVSQLEVLPFHLLSWEQFEQIQWRILRDVEGIRSSHLYGDRGQAQSGLDVIGLPTDKPGTALQSKKYDKFHASDLENAVTKWIEAERPFEVGTLIIGVSCVAQSTQVIDKLHELQQTLAPLTLELWDARVLSEKVRDRPEIVIPYFGIETARRFCHPFDVATPTVATADVTAFQEAIALTPGVSTGSNKLVDDAASLKRSHPEAALELVEGAQSRLRDAGFGPQAAAHEVLRSELLVAVGRHEEAARNLLDDIWMALDNGQATTAQLLIQRFSKFPSGDVVDRLAKVAETAFSLYSNPLTALPAPNELQSAEPIDSVRLSLLAGESALADNRVDWLVEALPLFNAQVTNELATSHQVRLRLLIAEVSGDWVQIRDDAIRGRLGNALGALVSARYARVCVREQRFVEARTYWEDAVRLALLDSRWDDAAVWAHSHRMSNLQVELGDDSELREVYNAIHEKGRGRPIVPVAEHASETASSSARDKKWRSAAISARRALRDAVIRADWSAESDAHRLLSHVLAGAGEIEAAARHLIRGTDTGAIEHFVATYPNTFVDVVGELDATNYWTVGTAYRFLAEEGDRIPDDRVPALTQRVQTEFDAYANGTLIDQPFWGFSRLNNAFKLAAAISPRLTGAAAHQLLEFFAQQEPVDANSYRYWDEAEAIAVAHIALTHPSLVQPAIAHLVPLLARSQPARTAVTVDAISSNMNEAKPHLTILAAAGDTWAVEVLATDQPADTPADVADEALKRLITPLVHKPGVTTVGTGAQRDANLVRGLDPARLIPALKESLVRSTDPLVAASDQSTYLTAAAQLAEMVAETTDDDLFDAALRRSTVTAASALTATVNQFQSALAAFRFNAGIDDSRQRALLVAATLARTAAQRAAVMEASYSFIGADQDYWLAVTYQQLGDAIDGHLGLLSAQGWALRSFAAIRWVSNPQPEFLGQRFAADPDVRVRRAFARTIGQAPDPICHLDIREALRRDPAYSVRLLVEPSSGEPPIQS